MNVILYGVSPETAGRIAARYGLEPVHAPAMFDASGCLLLVPRLHTTRQFLEWYEVLSQYANDVDAVILRGGPCTTASAVQYCAAHGKLFTLGNDLDDEAAEHELTAILDTLAGRICAHEGIRPVDSGTNP